MGINDFLKSGNERLDKQLLFTAEIDRMTDVLRRTLLINKSRRENDAEHSWHIAVMAMLFSEYAPEPIDIGRVVQMCVIHDIVETLLLLMKREMQVRRKEKKRLRTGFSQSFLRIREI